MYPRDLHSALVREINCQYVLHRFSIMLKSNNDNFFHNLLLNNFQME